MIRWPYNWRKKEGCPFKIPHLSGLVYWFDCRMENLFIKTTRLPKCGVYKGDGRKERITVSLTTFPKRLYECYYAIKSLMIQSYKADRIILWLADSQFPDRQLGKKLQKLIDRGLEIRYCNDLRSHKKYFYALQEQQEDELVITFDDDIIYDYRVLERLVKLHNNYPDCIICSRGHHVKLDNDNFAEYRKWAICSPEGVNTPSKFIMPSTGAGCLYPYGVMPKSTFNLELIRKYAFTADDIWMFFNRATTDTKVVKVAEKIPILCNVDGSQKEALTVINDINGQNQTVVNDLKLVFPQVLKNLLEPNTEVISDK